MKRTLAALMMVGVLVPAGCTRRLTGPEPRVVLEFTLSGTEGSPAQGITGHGVAINRGRTSVGRVIGCTPRAGVYFTVLDSTGSVVYLHDPTAPSLDCPMSVEVFQPGQQVPGSVLFGGKLYSASGSAYYAPAGRYSIVAGFVVYDTPDWSSANHTVEEKLSFNWSYP